MNDICLSQNDYGDKKHLSRDGKNVTLSFAMRFEPRMKLTGTASAMTVKTKIKEYKNERKQKKKKRNKSKQVKTQL